MAYLDDLADEIRLLAGKAEGDANVVARAALVDTISDINDRSSSEVIRSRATVSIAGNSYAPIEMPDTCRRIIEFGLYDSTTQRIIAPYTELDETEYHQMTANQVLTLLDTDARYFIVVDRSSNTMASGNENRLQVKVWPVPGSTIMGLARFFTPLTEDNADQLGNRLMLKNGAMSMLASWFPEVAKLHYKMYNDAVESHKRQHASTKRTGPIHTPSRIIRHNQLMKTLVN